MLLSKKLISFWINNLIELFKNYQDIVMKLKIKKL